MIFSQDYLQRKSLLKMRSSTSLYRTILLGIAHKGLGILTKIFTNIFLLPDRYADKCFFSFFRNFGAKIQKYLDICKFFSNFAAFFDSSNPKYNYSLK